MNDKQRYIFIDTETTGLDPRTHDVIEVAALVYEDGTEICRYNCEMSAAFGAFVDLEALQVNKRAFAGDVGETDDRVIRKNILYGFFLVGDIINKTCESEESANAESEVNETKYDISKLVQKIGAEKILPGSSRGELIFKEINNLAEVLQKKIEKKDEIQNNETINPTCIQGYFTGGAFAAPLTLLIWIIAYIVLIIKT